MMPKGLYPRQPRMVSGRLSLSPRVLECLRLLSQGRTHEEIADLMFVKDDSVYAYARRAVEQLGAANIVQAVVIAVREGLL